MIIIEKNNNDENQTIKIKRSPTNHNLCYQTTSYNRLKQIHTIFHRVNQQQYQIKVSHHLNSWDIPYRYYHSNMDPVKAFLNNNTIKNYINRFYWTNKRILYMR